MHIRFLNEGRSSVVSHRDVAQPNRCCSGGDSGVAHQANCGGGGFQVVHGTAGDRPRPQSAEVRKPNRQSHDNAQLAQRSQSAGCFGSGAMSAGRVRQSSPTAQCRRQRRFARRGVAGFTGAVQETNLLGFSFQSQSVCVVACALTRKFGRNTGVRILHGASPFVACSGRTASPITSERKQEAELRPVRHSRRKGINENRNVDQRSPAGREIGRAHV